MGFVREHRLQLASTDVNKLVEEVLAFVETNSLMASGIGWIDAHLLASVALSHAQLWTLDRRLTEIARSLGLQAGI